jgi:hypothetical protein
MNLGHPARGLAFIRHVTTEDRYQGGSIIIPEHIRDKVAKQQFNVIAVGEHERCEDEDCNRPHLHHGGWWKNLEHVCWAEAGDWVLCRNRSWAATPDPDIYVVRQSDILGKWVET